MSVSIKIDNVVKRYGDKTIIDGLSLEIQPGEFFTLLGPSGCGKTTLLRMIIGFNSIEGGEITVGDTVVNSIPVNKRNMGMVFQNYAIFPHMSVKKNVAFGLKNKKISNEEIESRISDILKVVHIEEYKDTMPENLSGGQQQRVALARAIVTHPKVLLMDEPLSNLDAKLRVELRNAIKNIQGQIGITTVYVTHDQEEALAVSDRIAVMNEGVIQQIGKPKEIYERPVNLFVANFIGTSNSIEGKISERLSRPCIEFEDGYYELLNDNHHVEGINEIVASVRPHEFIFSDKKEGIKGRIKNSMFLGMNTHYFVEQENGNMIEAIRDGGEHDIISNGEEVYLKLNMKKINIFNKIDGNNLYKEGECHVRS